jgi:CubicO group peptidase (beta-lactamase class C family)
MSFIAIAPRGRGGRQLEEAIRAAMEAWQQAPAVILSAVLAPGGDLVAVARGCGQEWEGIFPRPVRAASITKAMVGVLAAIMARERPGLLTTPVAEILGCNSSWARETTWEHVLTHTAGLPFDLDPRQWQEDQPPMGEAEILMAARELTPLWSAGRHWHYSNAGFGLVGLALERWSGQPFPTLLAERLLVPLGLHRTSAAPDASFDLGAMAPAGQVRSTVEDLLRFGRALAGLSPEVIDTTVLAEALAPRAVCGHGIVQGLGIQLDVAPEVPRPWSWGRIGGETTALLVEPGWGAALAWSPEPAAEGNHLRQLLTDVLDRALAIQGMATGDCETTGRWWLDGQPVSVARWGDRLVARLPGSPQPLSYGAEATARDHELHLSGWRLTRDPEASAWAPPEAQP